MSNKGMVLLTDSSHQIALLFKLIITPVSV